MRTMLWQLTRSQSTISRILTKRRRRRKATAKEEDQAPPLAGTRLLREPHQTAASQAGYPAYPGARVRKARLASTYRAFWRPDGSRKGAEDATKSNGSRRRTSQDRCAGSVCKADLSTFLTGRDSRVRHDEGTGDTGIVGPLASFRHTKEDMVLYAMQPAVSGRSYFSF